MKIRWGLLSVILSCGCVAGPDDFVADSTRETDESQIATQNSESDSPEIVQAANVRLESNADFRATPSGLKYRIIRDGKGRRPNKNSTVTCHYRGWLDNGKEFDSSYGKKAATFPLDGVIKGWTEGLQLIQEGGKIELEIPSELGYGAKGQPPTIPGGATLHFEVELFKVR